MVVDTAFLKELDRFDLALKKRVYSRYRGNQQSTYTGEGLLFKDYKDYVPGDDFRYIDWKVYARTEELYVKQFEEEHTEMVHVLVDSSASMDFGDPTKFEYAAKLGLGIAYLAYRAHNNFNLSTFNTHLHHLDAKANIFRAMDKINDAPIEGQTRFKEALFEYDDFIKSKSVLLIISDFLFNKEEIEEVIGRYKRNDIVLMQVLGKEEVALDIHGESLLEDAETDEEVKMYVSERMRSEYKQRLAQHVTAIEEMCDHFRVPFVPVTTADNIFEVFYDLLNILESQ